MIYVCAFAIPGIMYVITMFMTNMYPFGDNALLVSDINNQFAAFYTYFKHAVLSDDNLIYSFSKTLGGGMDGFSGYYLKNPLLFLLLPFDDEYIPVGIEMLVGLSICLMGLTMMVFLKNHFAKKCDSKWKVYGLLIFSTAYAFMGYIFAYIAVLAYFICFIMLPLIVLGIEKMVFDKKCILYTVSLGLTIIFNYYIGYMICIFSVMYFIYILSCESKYKDGKQYRRFVEGSIIAGGMSAFTVIPTVCSLGGGEKKAPTLELLRPHIEYGIKGLIRNMFPNAFYGDLSNACSPYIYVGVVILIFIIPFIVSRNITPKKKISGFILLGLLLSSTYISTLNIIFHGFNNPVGFAYRFSFLISFMMILLASEGYCSLKDTRIVRIVVFILCMIEFCELTVNAIHSLNMHENKALSEYVAYYNRTKEAIDDINEADNSFFRIEKDYEWNHNDAMLFAYNGLSHNSSCDLVAIKELMAKSGFRYHYPIWSFYNQGGTTFTDCFYGIKYLISRFDSTCKPYDFVYQVDGVNGQGEERSAYVFTNHYALPVAFGMKETELNADVNMENLFEVQNEMAGKRIYDSVNLVSVKGCESKSNASEEIASYFTGDFDGRNTVNMTEEGINDNTAVISNVTVDDNLYIDVRMNKSGNLYFYATAPNHQGARLYVNDSLIDDYFSYSRWNIVLLGQFMEDEVVNIRLEATDGTIDINNLYIYEEDIALVNEWYEMASVDLANINKVTSSHLTGTVNISDSDMLVFTIPYEKAWKVNIDGKVVNTEPVYGALMGVRLEKGEHSIDMIYVPEGKNIGILISVISVIILAYFTWKSRKGEHS